MPLIVAGMHRSGTSLVAHYLQMCGVNMGHSLLPPDEGNPLGYFEDEEILAFHREILRRRGIQTFRVDRTRLPLMLNDQERDHALELVRRRTSNRPWGWKDPRTTLFLDFWGDLLSEAVFLLLFRHPFAVMDSLIRRGTDLEIVARPVIALRAWYIYNKEIVRFSVAHPGRVLIYEIDHLIGDPTRFRDAVNAQWQLDLNGFTFAEIFQSPAFRASVAVPPRHLRLRHFRQLRKCKELYQQLQVLAE